jgi:hypothetical protein
MRALPLIYSVIVMENTEKLAYFLDDEAVRTIFPDWPVDIAVVLCLDEEGGCETVLHHRDEGRTVLRRVAKVLGRPAGGFCVTPEVDGYPTRRVLFSEEQKLLALLAAAEDMPDVAADYDRAYCRARELGLDMHAPAPRQASPAAGRPERRQRFTLRDVLRRQRPAEPALPPGYSRSSGRSGAECQFLAAEISVREQRVRLVIAPEKVTVRSKPVAVEEIGFRDDFARFVLPRAVLKGWQRGEASVLEIGLEHFPAELAALLAAFTREAEVTVTRQGVFVMPGGPSGPVPAAPPPPKRVVTPARLAVAALAATGILTGTVVNALRPVEPAPRATVAAPAAATLPVPEAPAALGLIAALAREEARGAGE